ncbi:MFS general substrate transporter, partial [Gloeophyllum trabeum ATCC 11539]
RWRLSAACLLSYLLGIQDSALGALIPSIEEYYHIGYALVAILFMTTAIGFVLASFVAQPAHSRFGRSACLVLGNGIMTVGYVIWTVCPREYGPLVIAPLLIGAGEAWLLAQINLFASTTPNPTVYNGYVHGCYGIGGVSGPLIATAMVSKGIKWSNFYFIPLGLSVWNGVFSGIVFREPKMRTERSSRQKKSNIMLETLRDKTTLITALFMFAYSGSEVSLAGWIVTFLINTRGGDPSKMGYAESGFWGGITVGRFVVSHLCFKYGERKAVFALLGGAIALEAIGWAVPSVIPDTVAIALVGVLLGPIYPCTMSVVTRILPKHLHVSSLSLISALGSSGGAAVPFTVGIIAQFKGPYVVHPTAIVAFALMEISWFILTRGQTLQS